jgi:hypothetical protein
MSITEILNMFDVPHGTFAASDYWMDPIAQMSCKFNGSGKMVEGVSCGFANDDTPKCGRLPKYRHCGR